MLQTWILRDRIDPVRAVRRGSDVSICGHCPLRGSAKEARRCYVNLGQAPLAIHRALASGRYPKVRGLDAIADLGAGRAIRLGSYGDPAAAPTELWEALVSKASTWTGYTHQWAEPSFDSRLLDLCMASVEDAGDITDLLSRHPGARYFRVRGPRTPRTRGEMQCPGAGEASHRLTCAECGACNGRAGQGRSVSIAAHGAVALTAWTSTS